MYGCPEEKQHKAINGQVFRLSFGSTFSTEESSFAICSFFCQVLSGFVHIQEVTWPLSLLPLRRMQSPISMATISFISGLFFQRPTFHT